MSLNTLMRMAVDDFDFDEIFLAEPRTALLLFWASAILLVFVLVNIFVAIILNAYVFDAGCCVYTCRRLIDLSLIAGTNGLWRRTPTQMTPRSSCQL